MSSTTAKRTPYEQDPEKELRELREAVRRCHTPYESMGVITTARSRGIPENEIADIFAGTE